MQQNYEPVFGYIHNKSSWCWSNAAMAVGKTVQYITQTSVEHVTKMSLKVYFWAAEIS